MSYIILNGIKNTMIEGLLIQTLPPISKPLMRTSVEQIDGRDGDIITKLGYSAYDKVVSIGLHGNFLIDDVIEYFNSEGSVVFSSEPDKVYDYQILKEIDFSRLIRFRTANVTFHVQPYKHSVVQEKLVFDASSIKSWQVFNQGNIISRPTITIKGSGVALLMINGKTVLSLNLSETGEISVDAEKMNAYYNDTLMNRFVSGDYDDIFFKTGENIISVAGEVTQISISNFSRWI